MKQLSLCAIFFFSILTCFGQSAVENTQDQYRQQTVFLEAGGPAILASVNYDIRFAKSRKGLGGRVGIGGFGSYVLGLNHLIGNKGKYLELGINLNVGQTPIPVITLDGADIKEVSSTKNGSLTIGYRYQAPSGGLNFRAALTPLFGKGYIWPYFAGVSVGYTFKNRK